MKYIITTYTEYMNRLTHTISKYYSVDNVASIGIPNSDLKYIK